MELRDLIVTPIILLVVYAVAYVVRPWVTDEVNKKYFLPALTVRIVGALAVGFIYQFYYEGGDTFMYHTHGSRHVWNAFMDSPTLGLKLLFAKGDLPIGTYHYASQIYFFKDPQSYAVIQMASILDLFTFSSYCSTAILFACFGFVGTWLFYLTFYEQYPGLHKGIAIAAFFIPTVFFWGSGLLKDTITFGCLGASTFFAYRIFLRRQFKPKFILLFAAALYGLYLIKIYILLTFLPAAILWVFASYYYRIRFSLIRMLLFPIVIGGSLYLAYVTIDVAASDNAKYSLSMISKTAQVTAYDIRYWSGREAGSGYALGKLDGTWESMLKMAPAGITVALFRPFFWEVKNPLMLLSALESFFLTVFTVYIIIQLRSRIFEVIRNPTIFFCLVFSLTFAFAVGVSTFNFGTLARYKVPLMPYYMVALVLLAGYLKSERKVAECAVTE